MNLALSLIPMAAISEPPPAYFYAIVLICSILVWVMILRAFGFNWRVLAYVPRPPVPWGGLEVLILMGMYFFFPALIVFGVASTFGSVGKTSLQITESFGKLVNEYAPPDSPQEHIAQAAPEDTNARDTGQEAPETVESVGSETDSSTAENSTAEDRDAEVLRSHPLVKLVHSRPTPGVILLIYFVAVIVAPLVEEFFFRLVLQGYLEKIEHRFRHTALSMIRPVPGLLPILMSSALFAMLHFRTASEKLPDVDVLLVLMIAGITGQLLALVTAIAFLRQACRATLQDLGLDPSMLVSDATIGVLTFVLIVLPLFSLQISLGALLPDLVPDMITLFPFACVLGFLYFRTHRLAPSIVLHMSLNFFSTTMAVLYSLYG